MVNKAILVGNLGADVEIMYSQSGTAIANFRMATNERYNNEDHIEWHRIVAFKRLAEICGEYLHKGSKVYIEGKIQTRKWEDKEGNTKYTTEIVAREMKMLDSRTEPKKETQDYGKPTPQHEDDSVPF